MLFSKLRYQNVINLIPLLIQDSHTIRYNTYILLSSEGGTCQAVQARFWPWLDGESPSILSTCYLFARKRTTSSLQRLWLRHPHHAVHQQLHSQQKFVSNHLFHFLERVRERGLAGLDAKIHARPFVRASQGRSWNHWVVLGAILWAFIAKTMTRSLKK